MNKKEINNERFMDEFFEMKLRLKNEVIVNKNLDNSINISDNKVNENIINHKEEEPYWKYIQGYENPYGKKFYDYVKENNIKFHGSKNYVKQAMYDSECNRRSGGKYKMITETSTLELGIALLCDLVLGN